MLLPALYMLICFVVAQNKVWPSMVIAADSKPMSPLLMVLQSTNPLVSDLLSHCGTAAMSGCWGITELQ